MWTLIGLGVGAAYAYSVVATVVPGIFPESLRDDEGMVAVYFEAAAVICTLTLLGQVLELRARATTGGAIKGLLDLAPPTARRVSPTTATRKVPLASIVVGDRVRVRPGRRYPSTACVESGRQRSTSRCSPASRSQLTRAGDRVIGGTLNTTGALVVTAAQVGADTVLSRVVEMVAAAQRSKAPMQRLADRVAGVFVLAVIGIAVAHVPGLGPGRPGPELGLRDHHRGVGADHRLPLRAGPGHPDVRHGRHRPGRQARRAVLRRRRDGEAPPDRHPRRGQDRHPDRRAAHRAAPCCRPRAGPISRSCTTRPARTGPASTRSPAAIIPQPSSGPAPGRARRLPGRPGAGVRAMIDGHAVVVGNMALMHEDRIPPRPRPGRAGRAGATVISVAVDGPRIGIIALTDAIKDTTGTRVDAAARRRHDAS